MQLLGWWDGIHEWIYEHDGEWILLPVMLVMCVLVNAAFVAAGVALYWAAYWFFTS